MRPSSIVSFERVYGVGILLGLVGAVLWLLHPPVVTFPADAPPSLAQMTHVVALVALIAGLAINVLLLYFIGRRGSDVARWIFVLFFAIGLAGVVARQFGPHVPVAMPPGMRVIGFVQVVIQAVCVWLVFRPDTKRWFGGRPR